MNMSNSFDYCYQLDNLAQSDPIKRYLMYFQLFC